MNLYLFLSVVVIYCFPTEDLVKDYAKFNIPYTGSWYIIMIIKITGFLDI